MLKTAALSCLIDVDNSPLDNDRFVAGLAAATPRAGAPDRVQPSHPAREPLP
jgi:hypothetical protein